MPECVVTIASPPQLVHKVSARGIYTSGKGSSSVGLTAYVTKDPETKELVLERYVEGVIHG